MLADLVGREVFCVLIHLSPKNTASLPLSSSSLRWPSDFTQRHHPLSGLAWLLQGCLELCLGDRSPAWLPHQNHLRQVLGTTASGEGVMGRFLLPGRESGVRGGTGTSTVKAGSQDTGANCLGRGDLPGFALGLGLCCGGPSAGQGRRLDYHSGCQSLSFS